MELIKQAFAKLLESKTIYEVDRIVDDLNIPKKNRMNTQIYPQLKFKIAKEDIEKLRIKKIIMDNNHLSNDISNSDTLTKLLYSVLWKNGDLKKVKHIIDGITSGKEEEKDDGLVFYQFGKYLTKESGEPIIDQHVLRAFGIFKANGDEIKIERLRRLSIIGKNEKELIRLYKVWLRTDLTKELRENEQYAYHVDKVLFAVGKTVKVKKRETA